MARWGDRFFDVRSAYPNVGRFMDRLSADPSVQFALSVEQTVDRGSQGAFEGRLSFDQLLAELGATARGRMDRSVELAAS